MAMELVSTITVGSGGAASIEFTSIPATGKDLLLVMSLKADTAAFRNYRLHINGDTSSTNYSQRRLLGDGSSVSSSSESSQDRIIFLVPGTNVTSNTFGNTQIYISNYAVSAAKSLSFDNVTENNATLSYQQLQAALWNNTAAITSLSISDSSVNTLQYSTASLYIIS
jgi:hypothetical protein